MGEKVMIVLCMLLFLSCEEAFNVDTDRVDISTIIVDGYIHQGDNPYRVTLSQVSTFGPPTPVARATVKIFNNDSLGIELKETQTGTYSSKRDVGFGISGQSYFLSIVLSSGATYQSGWVEMPSQGVENTLDWIEYQRVLTSDIGTDILIPVVGISLRAKLDELLSAPLFLSWSGEEVYQFIPTDFPDPFGSIPPPCYIQQPFGSEEVNLFSTLGFNGSEFVIDEIFWREIDDSFLRKHIFSVYGFSHSEDHYQYLKSLEALVENSGSLFDTPPGQAIGNIESLSSGFEKPLGYFGAVLTDTVRVAIYPNNLQTYIVDDCLYDPNMADFSDYSEICNNCGLIPRNVVRPEYWVSY